MTLFKWSKTAGSNDTADSTINWREGQGPGTVNDSARALMAAVAKYRDDLGGTVTTAGTSTAYTATSNQGSMVLANGLLLSIVPHATNGLNPTLNVDGTGAKNIVGATGQGLGAGNMVASTPYLVSYQSATTEWILVGYKGDPTTIPIGAFVPYCGLTAPNSQFVLPYGQAISRTTYAALFALTSTRHGAGDGSTTFNVIDMRGKAPFGLDNMGGVAAGLITTAVSGIDGTTAGATGGSQKTTIARSDLPNDTVTSSGGGTHSHAIIANATTTGTALSASNFVARGDATGATTDYSLVGTGTGATLGLTSTVGNHTHTIALNGGVTQTDMRNMPPAVVVPFLLRVI